MFVPCWGLRSLEKVSAELGCCIRDWSVGGSRGREIGTAEVESARGELEGRWRMMYRVRPEVESESESVGNLKILQMLKSPKTSGWIQD